MRIGLIGLGRIGAFHAETLLALDVVDELVITDPSPGLAATVAARTGATMQSSAAAVLDRGVDGVVIASSTPTHLDLIQAAVRAGVPTFCEKPVSDDPRAAMALSAELAASGVPVQIGFPRRFDPDFRRAKADLDAGTLGWLTSIRSTTMDPAPPPAAYVASSGGLFRDCSVHDFDAIRWVSGREVVEVYAAGSNRGDDFIRAAGDVDSATVLLTLDDGTLAVVSNTRYHGAGYDVRLELHGSKGSVAAGLDDGLPLRSADPRVSFPAGPAHVFFIDRLAEAFRASLAAFTEVVAGSAKPPCTFDDGLEATWIAEACTVSRFEHRPVRLEEVR